GRRPRQCRRGHRRPLGPDDQADDDRVRAELRARVFRRSGPDPLLRAALMPTQAQAIATLLPILIPALGGVWILVVVSVLGDRDVAWPAAHAMALLGLSAAAAVMLLSAGVRFELLGGALLIDRQALAFHLIFVTVAALTLL